MSNLALIQPQRVDFDTTQVTDWLDGLPMIGTPGFGGSLAGAANTGNGGLTVSAVTAGAAYGAHTATIISTTGGAAHISVAGPSGGVTGAGVVGLPLYAGGLSFTLLQGSVSFVTGDSFVLAVVPTPVDITGIQFDLDVRPAVDAALISLKASTAVSPPTIVNGGTAGVIAMTVPKSVLASVPTKPEGYPYAITATDLTSGLTVPAFYGLIHHFANTAAIDQEA